VFLPPFFCSLSIPARVFLVTVCATRALSSPSTDSVFLCGSREKQKKKYQGSLPFIPFPWKLTVPPFLPSLSFFFGVFVLLTKQTKTDGQANNRRMVVGKYQPSRCSSLLSRQRCVGVFFFFFFFFSQRNGRTRFLSELSSHSPKSENEQHFARGPGQCWPER